MSLEKMALVGGVLVLTVLSGLCDAQGFLFASRIWEGGQLRWEMVARSAAGFATGISLYYVLLKFLTALEIQAAEVQTLMWFGVTLLGVAILSGEFFKWPWTDQLVGGGVLAGIGWLMVRHTS